MKQKIRIAIFASGSGSNAENIIRHFEKHAKIEVHSLLCNNPEAFVLERLKSFDVNQKVFNKADLYETDEIKSYLDWYEIDYVILAGFLWLMPEKIINEFQNKIINIHPALLPAYGGKGMYGMNIHKAVIAHEEKETGITIHLVNAKYDEGRILFQIKTAINPGDNANTIAEKIHLLEQQYFPKVIEDFITTPPKVSKENYS